MDLLKNFLSRFEKIKNPKEDKIKIAEILSSFLGDEISPDQIIFKDAVVGVLKIHPVLKNKIFLEKNKIIVALKDKYPHIKIIDIK